MASTEAAGRVRVTTTRYVFSHGREPRGDGWWWFEVSDGEPAFSFRGGYGAARRAAREWAAERGATEVWVSP
jgi:hypothetical protein